MTKDEARRAVVEAARKLFGRARGNEAMMSKPGPDRPDLSELIKQANDRFNALSPGAQAAELRAQRISWVYGNLALDGSAVTKEQVARRIDEERGAAAERTQREVLCKPEKLSVADRLGTNPDRVHTDEGGSLPRRRGALDDGWRPIETAPPKTEAGVKPTQFLIGMWGQFGWIWKITDTFHYDLKFPNYGRMTHWHPLPPPPAPREGCPT